MEGEGRAGEEVWTRDKEARGRAETNKRYLDTLMRDGDVHGAETICNDYPTHQVKVCADKHDGWINLKRTVKSAGDAKKPSD